MVELRADPSPERADADAYAARVAETWARLGRIPVFLAGHPSAPDNPPCDPCRLRLAQSRRPYHPECLAALETGPPT